MVKLEALGSNTFVYAWLAGDYEFAGNDIHRNVARGRKLAVENLLAELVFDLALHSTTQWTRTESRVETDLD